MYGAVKGFGFLNTPMRARLGVIALAIFVWEVGAWTYNDPEFLAPASLSLISLADVIRDVEIIRAIGMMFWELFVAFFMALLAGLMLGMLVGINRPTFLTFFPIILMIYAMPQITILPLFVLIFGIGPAVKVAFGFSHGFFPIIVNVIAGTQNINPVLLTSARSMGASRAHIYRHVVFPHLVPSLFTGMRLGMTATLLGVILAELYATQKGIGYFTTHYSESFEPHNLFALVSLIAAAAIILNEILRRAEIRFGRWRN
jgi:NitT/TauT family transport system permease protein